MTLRLTPEIDVSDVVHGMGPDAFRGYMCGKIIEMIAAAGRGHDVQPMLKTAQAYIGRWLEVEADTPPTPRMPTPPSLP